MAKAGGDGEGAGLIAEARGGGGGEQLVGDAGHGGDDDGGVLAAAAAAGDDGGGALDGAGVLDRGAAELHDDEVWAGGAGGVIGGDHAVTAVARGMPSLVEFAERARSSALRTAAPAAPRMVLWERTTNFQSKSAAGAQAADDRRHAVAAHAIEPRLGAVDAGLDTRRAGAGAGGEVRAAASGWKSAQAARICFARRGFGAELERDALGVAVFDGDAVAVRGELEGGGVDVGGGQGAEELAAFFLQLFFFVFDEGDDVAEDVERRHAGVAGAADGLHGRDEDASRCRSARGWA